MSNGLDDVVAAETVLSEVDGLAGRLIIRGRSLDELAGTADYEEVLALLLAGFFDDLPSPDELGAALGRARTEVFERLPRELGDLADLPVVDAVRALMARLGDGDGDDLETALRLVAAPAVLAPAVVRAQRGAAPTAPDPDARHASDILRMLHGAGPDAQAAQALDTYLVTVCDHGLNASTFAARVVASTRAGLTSSVLAAISALKGPLHGGAPGPVLDMLDAIGRPEDAESWLEAALERGDRLMGFGHRVDRVRDPRADVLKQAVHRLASSGLATTDRFALAERVEAAALQLLTRRKPDRPLQTNVEFYTAMLLEALGFPRACFTCVFAMGRAGGWIGHAREQALYGRILRPRSRYVGPRPHAAA